MMQAPVVKGERCHNNQKEQHMKIPFGKHKGEDIHTLPKPYLNWLLTIDLDDHLRQAVEMGLQGKEYKPPTRNERIDKARHDMTARLRARDAGRTLFRVAM